MNIKIHQAVVIGAGPGGLATVTSLLDGGLDDIYWIDPSFNGGRLNTMYREISSNTKAGLYLDAVHASKTCNQIIQSTPSPNPVTRFQDMEGAKTCRLGMAGDMIMMLVGGLLGLPQVEKCVGEVEDASLGQDDIWSVNIKSQKRRVSTRRLFLCTGSYPSTSTLHMAYNPDLNVLDLDEVLRYSHLDDILPLPPTTAPSPPSSPTYTIAVIGNSHSGILVCRNLYTYSLAHSHLVKIINFSRRPIKYAKYLEGGGIVFDSTGLKGDTADWAREVMEEQGEGRCDAGVLEQIETSEGEEGVYKARLRECTHIVYAVGYERNEVPGIWVGGQRREGELEFDMHSSGFYLNESAEVGEGVRKAGDEEHGKVGSMGKPKRTRVKGLYGCGIAFPEEVEDPEGHMEKAVGLGKFFKFAERVKADWVGIR